MKKRLAFLFVLLLVNAGCVSQPDTGKEVSTTEAATTTTELTTTTATTASTIADTTTKPTTTTTTPPAKTRTMPEKQDWVMEDGVRIADGISPSVVKLSDGRYRMYATVNSIGSYVSSDGLEYAPEKSSVLNAGGIARVVRLSNGIYRMTYSTVEGKSMGFQSEKRVYFKSATSKDGTVFEPENVMRFQSKGGTAYTSLSTPDIFEFQGGLLRMYYTGDMFGTDFGREGFIRSASSPDGGVTWKRDDNVRIMHEAMNPDVVKTPDGRYYIYYAARPEDRDSRAMDIYAAVSDDGLKYKDLGIVLSSGRDDIRYNDPIVVEALEGYRMYYSETTIESGEEKTAIKSALLKTD